MHLDVFYSRVRLASSHYVKIFMCLSMLLSIIAYAVFKECPECKIIRTNLDRITRLISSDSSAGPTWFAQKLEEKAFIANAADAVVLGYTSYQQTSRLMSAIKGKISTSQEPGREFSEFLEILESNPQSEDLARELGLENGEFGLVITIWPCPNVLQKKAECISLGERPEKHLVMSCFHQCHKLASNLLPLSLSSFT